MHPCAWILATQRASLCMDRPLNVHPCAWILATQCASLCMDIGYSTCIPVHGYWLLNVHPCAWILATQRASLCMDIGHSMCIPVHGYWPLNVHPCAWILATQRASLCMDIGHSTCIPVHGYWPPQITITDTKKVSLQTLHPERGYDEVMEVSSDGTEVGTLHTNAQCTNTHLPPVWS